MGIGCRRDPLEANVWYVRAADQGEERAKKRIAAIQIAASGGPELPTPSTGKGSREAPKGRPSPTNGNNVEGSDSKEKPKRWGIF
jgi:TPR repeat protein